MRRTQGTIHLPTVFLAVMLGLSDSGRPEEGVDAPTKNTETSHMPKPYPDPDTLAELPADGGSEYNRLVFEKSPYLLQHCRNPVDWYPWGEEAFETARSTGRPVFLSIGYATCHWCHVMEHESFEDKEVADLMNKHFVCIKVDREERPDIDAVYMTVTQALTGSGGWPMTVVMTPDKEPFFAGTYFPKNSKFGRIGMMDLLPRIHEFWSTEKDRALESAREIASKLGDTAHRTPGRMPGSEVLDLAYDGLDQSFDPKKGGFGRAPKFPVPHNLRFLIRYAHRAGRKRAAEMAIQTLKAMRLGGIYDHVGFGFHRYSTDSNWLLPHFEKMLYDQALMVSAYLEAYEYSRDPMLSQTAKEILEYVNRDMTSEEGGFYSAEDADSEGEEGKFYVWTKQEIHSVLDAEDAELVCRLFGVVEGGNFSDEATGHQSGANILHLNRTLDEWALKLEVNSEGLSDRIATCRARLFAAREKRIHPLKDDKILTDWNGLMIAAFARAATVLNNEAYLQTARRATDFVNRRLRDKNGFLLKRYRKGDAGLPAHLEDYAFFVTGLIELYEAGFDPDHLKEAVVLTDKMVDLFYDETNGGFFQTADNGEKLLFRPKEGYDGALPSGNSVAAENLLRLSRLTGRMDYAEKAEAVIKVFAGSLNAAFLGHSHLMLALDFALGPTVEVTLAGSTGSEGYLQMIGALNSVYQPRKVVLVHPSNNPEQARLMEKLAPFTKNQVPTGDQVTAYVCRNFACLKPTTNPEEMVNHLEAALK